MASAVSKVSHVALEFILRSLTRGFSCFQDTDGRDLSVEICPEDALLVHFGEPAPVAVLPSVPLKVVEVGCRLELSTQRKVRVKR